MRLKSPAVLFLAAALLAGCAGAPSESGSQPPPDQSPPPPTQSAAASEPDAPSESFFVDDPASPYPMVVDSWSVDLDGDGVDELVELRAEKTYFGNESEPDKWFEGDGVMHPYTLVVTQGETVWELPLGWEDNGSPPLSPIYWDEERTGRVGPRTGPGDRFWSSGLTPFPGCLTSTLWDFKEGNRFFCPSPRASFRPSRTIGLNGILRR